MASPSEFHPAHNKIRPKDHIDLLKPCLPPRYSPLQTSGNGIQSVYLTEVPFLLAEALIGLIGVEARVVTGKAEEVSLQAETLTDNADVELWEHHIEATIDSDAALPQTDREALIIARPSTMYCKIPVNNRARHSLSGNGEVV